MPWEIHKDLFQLLIFSCTFPGCKMRSNAKREIIRHVQIQHNSREEIRVMRHDISEFFDKIEVNLTCSDVRSRLYSVSISNSRQSRTILFEIYPRMTGLIIKNSNPRKPNFLAILMNKLHFLLVLSHKKVYANFHTFCLKSFFQS